MKLKPFISPYSFPGIKSNLIQDFMVNKNKNNKHRLSAEDVMKIVSEESGVTIPEILSKCRKTEKVTARHIFCYMMVRKFKYTLTSVGEMLQGRDHTTIRAAVIVCEDRTKNEEFYKELVDKVNFKISLIS